MNKNYLLLALSLFIFSVTQAQLNIELLGQLSYGATQLANIWGWADGDGHEYALVGTGDGTSIVDVTDPTTPVEVQFIDGNNSIWRELTTWGNYAYVVTEADGGLLAIDLSGLPDTVIYNYTECGIGLTSGHTVKAEQNGIIHIFGSNLYSGGDVMLDATADPLNPTFVGAVDEWYIHDGFARGDTLWAANIYEGQFSVWDVSDKTSPVLLATQETPGVFTHNCWPTPDNKYLFTTDEVSNAVVEAYDVSDLTDIKSLDDFRANPGTSSIPHNTTVRGNFLITSWYRDGVIITDITNPDNMIKTGYYDTSPLSGDGFNGCWGVYPYLPSGNIIASDIEGGLFVLGPSYIQACYLNGTATDATSGLPIYGVAINISATPEAATTSDLLGQYATGTATAGTYDITFNLTGYFPQTISGVSLENGITTIVNAELTPYFSFPLTGQVIDASTGLGIPGANVFIQNDTLAFNLITDASGSFTISTFYPSSYNVYAGKWGYITNELAAISITSDSSLNIILDRGYYDDFFFDFGWTTTSTASSGDWVIAEPIGTTYAGGYVNPEYDIDDDYGATCYVTGNLGISAGSDDVDDGIVTLTSPAFDLSTYSDPYITYARWFYNNGGAGPAPNDSINIYLSNGTTTILLDEQDGLTPFAEWADKSFRISDFITPSSNMHLIIETSDIPPDGHYVEAAFDKLYIFDSITIAPTAAFNADDVSGCTPASIHFNDMSIGATSWSWNFPGGTPSTSALASPTIIYNAAGIYDVTLTVTNALGSDVGLMLSYITVYESPVLTTSAGTGTATVTISGGVAPYTILWNDAAAQTTATATGLAVGDYTVTVTDASGCTVSATVSVTQANAIQNILPGVQLNIYPNPFSQIIYLEINTVNNADDFILELKDLTGNLMKTIKVHNGENIIQFDMSIPDGLYIGVLKTNSQVSNIFNLIKMRN